MTAWIYCRKSVMTDASKTLSPQVQEERCRALAAANGDGDDILVVSDLDVSGAKVAERPGYLRLVKAIESGDAHAVYAFDLSRLHRNTKEALRFFELAAEHKVPVRLVADSIDTATASGRMMLTILAAMNAWTSQVTSEKIKASLVMKRLSGWKDGGRVYGEIRTIVHRDGTERIVGIGEDPQAVVDALRSTESLSRASRYLNSIGMPTRNGKSRGWSPAAVKSVVARQAPELLSNPADTSRLSVEGSKAGDRAQRFARLLRCGTCGSMLSPSVNARQGGYVQYYCHKANTLPHGRKSIAEKTLLPIFREEMEHARLIRKKVRRGHAGDEVELARLDAKRTRVNEIYETGTTMDKATWTRKLGEITKAESGLSVMRELIQISLPLDVGDEPARVNAYLRLLLDHAVVDMAKPARKGGAPGITFDWRDQAAMRVPQVRS